MSSKDGNFVVTGFGAGSIRSRSLKVGDDSPERVAFGSSTLAGARPSRPWQNPRYWKTTRQLGVGMISGDNWEQKLLCQFQTVRNVLWIAYPANTSAIKAFLRPWACRGLPQPLNLRSSNPMLNPAACTNTRFSTLSVPRTYIRRMLPVS